jgi:hypothetical protein
MRSRVSSSITVAALVFEAALGLACDDDHGDSEAPVIGDPEYPRDPALDVPLVSANGGQSSHNEGENCVQCHQSHGPGRGLFTVAGTVYEGEGEVSPDATVELWTGLGGTGELRLRIEADARGNFFTTESINFFGDDPLYPFVTAKDGDRVNFMPFPTDSGACNICHVGGLLIRL